MRRMNFGMTLQLLFVSALLIAPAVSAIELGQTDDFESGLQGWGSGGANPNPPAVGAGEGPDGAGDNAMLVTSNGGGGAGGKLVVFNTAQWSGDYLAAGVTAIEMDLQNRSGVALDIRLAVRRNTQGWATTSAVSLPANSEWMRVTLSVLPADLTFVGMGGANVESTLADVQELRILHSAAPDDRGDIVTAQLGVDNITARRNLSCASGPLGAKATEPSDLLVLPGFEVDGDNPTGLTTLFTVHNLEDTPLTAQVQYFDRTSDVPLFTELVDLGPRASLAQNVRARLESFTADPDGFFRGWISIAACDVGDDELRMARIDDKGVVPAPPATGRLTGEYFFQDQVNELAIGDSLLRPDEFCQKLQARLVFNLTPESIKLRLFATNPRGDNFMIDPPTATVRVFNESGVEQEANDLFLEDSVVIISPTELTDAAFGVLELDFESQGAGALTIEYRLGDTFSVSMNANCLGTDLF